MNLEEKLQVAQVLEEMGVDIIEAGFPIASKGDFEAVQAVAAKVKEARVAGLARATRRDIDRAAEALNGAAAPRSHTFIPTSPLHLKFQPQLESEQVHQAVLGSTGPARAQKSVEKGKRM